MPSGDGLQLMKRKTGTTEGTQDKRQDTGPEIASTMYFLLYSFSA